MIFNQENNIREKYYMLTRSEQILEKNHATISLCSTNARKTQIENLSFALRKWPFYRKIIVLKLLV